MTARDRAPARRARGSREVHAPRASFEELEIRTEDGVALRAVVDDPPEGTALRGTCVLAHAMFARKTEFGRRDREGLAQLYAARGWRAIAFDFRGHGESTLVNGPRGATGDNGASGDKEWGYDDLVRRDLPAVVGCARARSEGLPVIVVGHSLGAHVALAAQGSGHIAASGIISIAGNVWLRELEPSRLRWAAKSAFARAALAAVTRIGSLPARRLRIGSDDASELVIRDVFRGMLSDGHWRSTDSRDDYLASLANVTVPVCSVASDGDRITCHPDAAAAFVGRCSGPVELLRVTRSDDGRAPPGHMTLVTTARAHSTLLAALSWMESQL